MKVAVLVINGVFDTGLSLVRDAFSIANRLATSKSLRFDVTEVGVRRRIVSHHGRRIEVTTAGFGRKPDVMMVPGPAVSSDDDMEQLLGRREIEDAVNLIQDSHAKGIRCAAACSATFMLAESGALDGRVATTTWWLSPLFRSRYPNVELDERRMVVETGNVLTAGAALGHLDAALALIRGRSPQLARRIAEHLAIDARASQAPFIVPSFLACSDPMLERFEQWVRARIREPFSMGAAAKAVKTCPSRFT